MENNSSRIEAIDGRITGSMFFSAFGALWLIAARWLSHQLSAPILIGAALATAALWLIAARMHRQLPKVEKDAEMLAREQRMSKIFGRVNAAQWIAIALTVIACNILQQPMRIAPCVAVIVGLHFFPLAKLFDNRLHYATGAALTLWPIACVLSQPATQAATNAAQGAGVILWASAAAALLVAAKQSRKISGEK